jgi:hypothetical protein
MAKIFSIKSCWHYLVCLDYSLCHSLCNRPDQHFKISEREMVQTIGRVRTNGTQQLPDTIIGIDSIHSSNQ